MFTANWKIWPLPLLLLAVCPAPRSAWAVTVGRGAPGELRVAARPAPRPAAARDPVEPETNLTEPAPPLAAKTARSEEELLRLESAALYAHGRVLLQRQDHAGALRRFQRAWRRNPAAARLLPEIVFLAHNLQRREEAARYALLAAERVEMDPLLLRQLALQLDEREQWRRALRLYEKAWQARYGSAPDQPATTSGDVLLQMEMGRLYFLVEDYARSAAVFARVREALEHPERVSHNESLQKLVLGQPDRTYRILAEAFLQAGRLDDAEALFRKAQATAKNAPQLAFQLARLAAKRGRHDEALRQLDSYLQAHATSEGGAPYALLREQLQATIKDPAAAREKLIARLSQRAAADPENRALTAALAGAYRDAQRWADAEKEYRRLIGLHAPLAAYAGLADVYWQQGQTDRLLTTLGDAVVAAKSFQPLEQIAERPGSAPQRAALVALARRQLADKDHPPAAGPLLAAAALALEDKQYAAAEELGERGLSVVDAEARPPLALSWGVDLLVARRYAAAACVFRRAVEEQPDPDRRNIPRFYLVRALALLGRHDEALTVAEELASLNPDSARFQTQPAWVLYQAKRYEPAEQRYREVLKKFEPRHDASETREVLRDVRLALSGIGTHRQQTAQAETWLEQVLDEFPEDAGALNDLGYLWTEQRKHLHRAVVMVQQAVQEEPNNPAYIDSLGWAFYQLGRYPEAVVQLEKAAAGEAADGVILDHLGDAYLKVNEKSKAVASWQKAVAAFRQRKESQKIEAVVVKIKQCEK